MKLIDCDICRAAVQLSGRLKSCRCKNIKGKYVDQRNIIIYVKDKTKSRILGLDNSVRFGSKKEGVAWIIPFDNETVKKLVVSNRP